MGYSPQNRLIINPLSISCELWAELQSAESQLLHGRLYGLNDCGDPRKFQVVGRDGEEAWGKAIYPFEICWERSVLTELWARIGLL